jgi:CheY-like chemotaxis protein
MNILLIEDDLELAQSLSGGFREQGYAVDHVADLWRGCSSPRSQQHQVIVLDRMLPLLDGLSLVKRLRASNVLTPVIYLTTMSGIDDRVHGLEAGADDYLVKAVLRSSSCWHESACWHVARQRKSRDPAARGDLKWICCSGRWTRAGRGDRAAAAGVSPARVSDAQCQSRRYAQHAARERVGHSLRSADQRRRATSAGCAPSSIMARMPIRSRRSAARDTSCLRRTRIFRTESSRLAALFAALFLALAGALIAVVYWIVEDTQTAALLNVIDADISTINNGYQERGVDEAVEIVRQRLGSSDYSNVDLPGGYILLEDSAKGKLAGNLASRAPQLG